MDELEEYLNSELRNPEFRKWYQHFSSKRRGCFTCKIWSRVPLIGKPIAAAHSRKVTGREGKVP